jgi:hypothetical protein
MSPELINASAGGAGGPSCGRRQRQHAQVVSDRGGECSQEGRRRMEQPRDHGNGGENVELNDDEMLIASDEPNPQKAGFS